MTDTNAYTEEVRLAREGELTLSRAQQLRADLLECLGRGAPVMVDLEQVAEMDLACLQVLESARRSFQARGQALRILWSDPVRQTWNDAGYPRVE